MNDQALIERMNAHRPRFIQLLGGRIVAADPAARTAAFEFEVSTDYCHSVDIVQGGFITAMLDAAMTHAVFASDREIAGVSSLEIKTSYLEASRAGVLRAEGMVLRSSYKTVFLEGRLYNPAGQLTATASSVAKLLRKPAG